MRKRWVTLINALSLADSQTVTQILDKSLKIYQLRAHYENTNGATSNTVGNLHSMVSKLQVLDGSRVLHSLSMAEELGLNAYRHGLLPALYLTQNASGVVKEDCYVDFWMNDDDDAHYLDLSGYSSPSLAFTHNFTVSATAGFATGKGVLTVEALVADTGAPGSGGFLLAKEFRSFTAASSGVDTELLALDLPYVALITFAALNTADPNATLTHARLDLDSDTFVAYDRDTAQIADELEFTFGPFQQSMADITGGVASTFDFDLYRHTGAAFDAPGATSAGIITTVTANEAKGVKVTGGTTIPSARIFGHMPLGALYLPFGNGTDVNDFLNPSGLKQLRLQLTQGAANSVQLVTLQMAAR